MLGLIVCITLLVEFEAQSSTYISTVDIVCSARDTKSCVVPFESKHRIYCP